MDLTLIFIMYMFGILITIISEKYRDTFIGKLIFEEKN